MTRCQRCAEIGPDRQCPSCAVDSRGEAFSMFCLGALVVFALIAAFVGVSEGVF